MQRSIACRRQILSLNKPALFKPQFLSSYFFIKKHILPFVLFLATLSHEMMSSVVATFPISSFSKTGNGICPDSIITENIQFASYAFTLSGLDEGEVVTWDFGDGIQLTEDSTVAHTFMAGTYQVTATFFDADCQGDGTTILSTTIEVTSCGIELSVVENDGGLFTVTAIGIPEEYPMYWDMGDGTNIVETWVVDHIYEPGTYSVCAWYQSELCPDTVTACAEFTYEIAPSCTAEFTFEVDQNAQTISLHALDSSIATSYFWQVEDGETSTESDFSFAAPQGIYPVCLTVTNGSCIATKCDTLLMSCAQNDYVISITGIYSHAGTDSLVMVGSFDLMPLFQEEFGLDSVQNSAFVYVCSNTDCFHLHLYNAVSLSADSIHLMIEYPDGPALLLDTTIANSFSMLEGYIVSVGEPDCFKFDVPSEDENSAILLFPNPANDRITIQCLRPTNFILYDTLGKIVWSQKNSANSTFIDASNFTRGIYHLVAIHEGRITSFRIDFQ